MSETPNEYRNIVAFKDDDAVRKALLRAADELELMRNTERERIVSRLHELSGLCSHCGEPQCRHGANTNLPGRLDLQDVLRAINLDNHFSEDTSDK